MPSATTLKKAANRAPHWAPALAAFGVCALSAALFLPHQSLWIDESTQLAGLTLGPARTLAWLLDSRVVDLGVPGDRMPPLSYWLGWLWSRGFGLDEWGMRWFGVPWVALGAAAVAAAAGRAFGAPAAWVAGGLAALCPNVAYLGVEIRAYPLFFAVSAVAVYFWVRLVLDPRERGALIGLAVALFCATQTHFFALTLIGALALGLLVALRAWPVPRSLGLLAKVLVPSALGVLLSLPFARAAAGISTVDDQRLRVREVVQLLYRTVVHPAAIYDVVVALTLAAAAVMFALVVRFGRTTSRALGTPGGALGEGERRQVPLGLAAALVSGLAVSALANFAVGGFTAAKVSYGTWALPVLFVILAGAVGGLGAVAARWQRVGLVAAVVLLAAYAFATVQLWLRGDYFAHGTHGKIQAVLAAAGDPLRTAVVHDRGDLFGFSYFPLRFQNGPGLTQIVVAPDGHTPLGHGATPASLPRALGKFDRAVFIRVRVDGSRDVAAQIRHGDRPVGQPPGSSLPVALDGWRETSRHLFVSFVTAEVRVLERALRR